LLNENTTRDVTSAAEALPFIYQDGLPPPADQNEYTLQELQAYRPFAQIWTNTEAGLTKKRISRDGARLGFAAAGEIRIEIFRDVPPQIANDPAEIDRTFGNYVGQIIDELCDLSGAAGYLEFDQITLEHIHRTHPDHLPTQGDSQWCLLALHYDEGSGE